MRLHHRPSRERARGVALIAVLWLIAILTLLATTVATLSVSHRRAAQRFTEAVQLDSLADSAIRVMLLRLIAPKSPNERVAVGGVQRLELFGGVVDVTVERELGRIDINTAAEELIFALFAANGWEDQRARAMANRIADWKDTDDLRREGGAERDDYRTAGLEYAPRNSAFESPEELRQVLGANEITPDLFNSITVYTHAQSLPEALATGPVMRALALADERQLGGHRWIVAREPLSDGSSPGLSPVAAADGPATLIGEVVRIRSCAKRQALERCRTSIVRLTGSASTPVQIFAWQAAAASVSLMER